MTEIKKSEQNLRTACNHLFKVSKRWWAASWWLKIVTFIAGLIAILMPNTSIIVPIVVVVVAYISESFNIRSSNFRGQAESLSRKIDFRNSLGWKIKETEIADIMNMLPNRFRIFPSVKRMTFIFPV